MSASEFSVVIVSYDTQEQLRLCLTALQDEPRGEVIVVDNASPDGSAEMVRADFPWVTLVANDDNRGYGAAANQAVNASSSEYVLLLNGDAAPRPGALSALAQYLDDHGEAAIVGPRLVNPDGTRQASCYPFLTPANVLLVMSGLNGVIARIPILARRHLPTSSRISAGRVPWVKGAALAIRAPVFKSLGGFDERFFLYGEEQDLCYRLRQVGWETHFAPAATVSHVERASSRGRDAEVAEQVYRSLVRFYRKHYARRTLVALRLVLGVLMIGRIVRDVALLARVRERRRRSELRRNIAVWRRVLWGRLSRTATLGP